MPRKKKVTNPQSHLPSYLRWLWGEMLWSYQLQEMVRFLRFGPDNTVVVATVNGLRELPYRLDMDQLCRPEHRK